MFLQRRDLTIHTIHAVGLWETVVLISVFLWLVKTLITAYFVSSIPETYNAIYGVSNGMCNIGIMPRMFLLLEEFVEVARFMCLKGLSIIGGFSPHTGHIPPITCSVHILFHLTLLRCTVTCCSYTTTCILCISLIPGWLLD